MAKCQETLKVSAGEEKWSRVSLLGAFAMLIREEHECRPKAQALSPFTMDMNVSLKVKHLRPWNTWEVQCVQLDSVRVHPRVLSVQSCWISTWFHFYVLAVHEMLCVHSFTFIGINTTVSSGLWLADKWVEVIRYVSYRWLFQGPPKRPLINGKPSLCFRNSSSCCKQILFKEQSDTVILPRVTQEHGISFMHPVSPGHLWSGLAKTKKQRHC